MAGKNNNKDAAMSAHLKAIGMYHGRTGTTTHAPPVPKMSDVGSAAFRRRLAKQREGR